MMSGSVKVLGTGLLIGLGLTLALVRLMTSIVFGVSPTDPTILAGTAAALAALALVAAYVPTRVAGRVDSAVLLRSH